MTGVADWSRVAAEHPSRPRGLTVVDDDVQPAAVIRVAIPRRCVTTNLTRVRFLLPVIAFLLVTGAVAVSLIQIHVYENDRQDAALALVEVEAAVAREDALAIMVNGPAATFPERVELAFTATGVRIALAALGSRHVDAEDVAGITAAYGRYQTQRAAEDALFLTEPAEQVRIDGERLVAPAREALSSVLAATSREGADGGARAGELATRLSSALVVAVAAAGALGLRRLARRHTARATRHAEERLVGGSARSFRQLFDDNPQPMFVVEVDTLGIQAANGAAVAEYGFSPEELLDMTIADLRWPGDSPPPATLTDAVAEGRRDFPAVRCRTRDGRCVDVELHLREVDFRGRSAWLAVIDDVTEQVRLNAELVERARSFRALFEGNPQPMFVWEAGTFRILAANEAAVVQYGYTRDELLGMGIPDLRWPAEHAQFTEIANAIAVDGRREFQGIRHRTKGGRGFDVEIQVREVDFEGLRVWLTVIDDVTERIRLHRELEHQAFHDSLTGLPNRALFHNRVEHVHQRLGRSPRRYAVLMLDLDDFKSVNDGFGHDAGDELLLEVSSRLAGGVRLADTAARLGGDEFGILLEDLVGEVEAVEVADRLVRALRRPFAVAGRSVTLGATIGIALSGEATAKATDVVRNADVALFAGKAAGKDRHLLFSEDMHAAVLERITLEQELREGISREEFVLRYQPKVDSRSGRVVGVEALVRWNHPLRGLLTPDAFLALAEESGLIVELDAWVLDTACRQASAWARSATGTVPVAVNVSGRDLGGDALLGQVRRLLQETGLDPRLLELELTESAVVQQEGEALVMLREIRALGVHIAIDDFGTGFSILSRLQDFPVDTLKIDGSFIGRITSMDTESPIVSATVAMGLGLGLEVVAEGVETEQQRMYLVRQGCGQLQGYLISRPVEPELIPPMLLVSPLPPIEDLRWAALESAVGVVAFEPPVDDLVRGLLVELQRLTGLDSVYLTRDPGEWGDRRILFSRGSSPITGPDRRTLAPADDRRTSVGVPVVLADGTTFGTLGGSSERRLPLAEPGLEVMRIFASLIAAQIAIPNGHHPGARAS